MRLRDKENRAVVIRVLAGVVPMIGGALIYTGIIPVGKWVMGSAAPNPVDMIRTVQAAEQFSRTSSAAESDPDADHATSSMSEAQRRALRIQAARTRALRRGGEEGDAGWAPSSGGWGR